jgi:hypothetical protein
MRLQIGKFDPGTLKKHRIIIMVGKRGTGKSTLLKDVMYHLANSVDFGLAMTPTEESCEMFREHMPEQWIYNGFNATKLDAMLNIQRELGKKKKQRDLFVVMDDCMYDKKVLKGVGMRDLFMNGRHLHVTLMNAIQYIMDMGPDLRTQVDYVFALRENIISNKMKLWKYFFGMFDKFEDFSRVMDRCTNNHGALVLDNTAKSNRLEDCIFWYKAALDIPSFTMGKDLYIRLATQYEKTEEDMQKDDAARITTVERKDERGNTIQEDEVQLLID